MCPLKARSASRQEDLQEKACLEESQFIKDLLGKETAKKLTAAYYYGKEKVKKYLQLCG